MKKSLNSFKSMLQQIDCIRWIFQASDAIYPPNTGIWYVYWVNTYGRFQVTLDSFDQKQNWFWWINRNGIYVDSMLLFRHLLYL